MLRYSFRELFVGGWGGPKNYMFEEFFWQNRIRHVKLPTGICFWADLMRYLLQNAIISNFSPSHIHPPPCQKKHVFEKKIYDHTLPNVSFWSFFNIGTWGLRVIVFEIFAIFMFLKSTCSRSNILKNITRRAQISILKKSYFVEIQL